MEVKGIERWGGDWRNVVVGELLSVEKHPARRPAVADPRHASATASRSRSSAARRTSPPGQRVPVALPGAVLPGDRRIERTEKMGVVSNGMLCSGDELGPHRRRRRDPDPARRTRRSAPPLTDLYGDIVLDVDVKPNRGDALSHRSGSPARSPRSPARRCAGPTTDPVEDERRPSTDRLAVEVARPGRCARGSSAAGSTASRSGPSPDRVQMRLLAAGMRPISNVVDASATT